MPRIKATRSPRDYPLELIRGRLDTSSYTKAYLAEKLGKSERTVERWLARPSDEWPLGLLKRTCRLLDIPMDELRSAIKWVS